jgi:hypothetical protein
VVGNFIVAGWSMLRLLLLDHLLKEFLGHLLCLLLLLVFSSFLRRFLSRSSSPFLFSSSLESESE